MTTKMWSAQVNHSSSGNKEESNNQNLKTLGMTSAISIAGPKPTDIARTIELLEVLKTMGVFEDEKELNHRMEILR